MKTFIYSTHEFDKKFILEANQNHDLFFTEDALNEQTYELAKGCEAIAIFSNDKASDEVLTKLASIGIRFIALRSVGFDHVQLEKAKELGIKVANVPEYSPYAIAEHSVALLLCFNRKLIQANQLFNKKDFRLDSLIGFDLKNKTIGIIGTGKIGMAFASIMNGFGCKILAFDPIQNNEIDYIEYCSLNTLLKISDVVSINCPLNESTKYLIDKDELALMKKNSILINTARGGVVNTKALIDALKTNQIAGACLDVYEKEKGLYFYDYQNKQISDELFNELIQLDNVLMTGHQAFLTEEALIGIANTTIENLNEWEEKGYSKNDIH